MTEDAHRLRDLNRLIREAATAGNVEEMVILGEKRRQFLDTLPKPEGARSDALVSALEEAVNDNNGFIHTLERAMQQARARGKITLQARRRYSKIQTTP